MASESSMLQQNTPIFERLLDYFPDIIQSVDKAGNIVYANRKASEILGYSSEELLGMNIRQLYAPEILEQVDRGFDRLQRQGNLSVCESVVLDKQGRRIPVEIRSFAVHGDAGEFVRTFSILRDLRSIKELQDSLLHAGRLASVGELAATIVHDIANPLGVIKLSGELLHCELQELADKGVEDATGALRESLQIVDKAAVRIETLINHLRNLARTSDEKPELVDLRQSVADALFMVKSKVSKGGIAVVQDIPETECLVLGHGIQLEQVFMNLAGNACDAMKGVENPTLTLRLASAVHEDADAPSWFCEVSDNGKGMPPEVMARVFDSFFTTKPKGEGTGLGLAIVQSAMRKHGGDIRVTSEPGCGTTFTVILPQARRPA